ncbi:MAG: hypothetical protein C4576_11505 [Desulfobacteraceae bacterium]|nr:MAG: hypothetical protein C4576_11505 [Desulfobacteraceae bacterium]
MEHRVEREIRRVQGEGRIPTMKGLRSALSDLLSVELEASLVLLSLQGRVVLHPVDREPGAMEYIGVWYGVVTLTK